MKVEERDQARVLRKEGWAITDIATELGFAKSSVSVWVRDVELTEEFREALRLRMPSQNPGLLGDKRAEAGKKAQQTWLNRRLEYQKLGRVQAEKEEPLHIKGCMLYWAEGMKSVNTLKFANSDVGMTSLFYRFL